MGEEEGVVEGVDLEEGVVVLEEEGVDLGEGAEAVEGVGSLLVGVVEEVASVGVGVGGSVGVEDEVVAGIEYYDLFVCYYYDSHCCCNSKLHML